MQPVQQQYNEAKLVNKATAKAISISASLNDPHFKLSALFLQYALPVFENANAFLQKDEPVIHLQWVRQHLRFHLDQWRCAIH